MPAKNSVRFLLRENLGKLARELRFLGYDAALFKGIGFSNAVRLAERDDRILLTRSRQESKSKKKVKLRLICSEKVSEQLSELKDILEFRQELLFTRCSICNKNLYEIDKKKIISLVPEYVYAQHDHFQICRYCGRIYWQGNHYQAVQKRLKNLLEDG